MKKIFAKEALLPTGWAQNVSLEILETGCFGEVSADSSPDGADLVLSDQMLLPSLSNVHSHGFQRGLVGLTGEALPHHPDDFWSWRTALYRFLDQLTPEHVEILTSYAYMEMLEAGFTSVGEFHYLHHDLFGKRYDSNTEMAERIFQAAQNTGIGLTFLPVCYLYGGAGRKDLERAQLRLGMKDISEFGQYVEDVAGKVKAQGIPDDFTLGIAPHSLRALCPDSLKELCAAFPKTLKHIHVAEQRAEVEQIQMWLGKTPVEWLAEEVGLSPDWTLVHATHITDEEQDKIVESGAVVGLCPVTEADLGDGVFPARDFHKKRGSWGIGTDSHISVNPFQELQYLEYGQRNVREKRNVLAEEGKTVGRASYDMGLAGGAVSLGRHNKGLQKGGVADMISIDREHPDLSHLQEDCVLDGLIFGSRKTYVNQVWSAGRCCVQQGRHFHHDEISRAYVQVMKALLNG